jgi:hypothetical protein
MVDVVNVLIVITIPRFCVLNLLLQTLALLPMQAQKLLESPSSQHQSWELELLNVVQWQFLEQQKRTASALSVSPQSHVFVGLNTRFPLLS